MSRGIIIMLLVGVGFMYLVVNIVGEAESTTPGLENSQSRKAKEYASYYTKDINGDDMLNLANISMEKAKDVWKESPIKLRIVNRFPDFDGMKEIARTQLTKSDFKTFLIKKLKKIEGDYIDGVLNLDEVRLSLENLN